MNVTPILVFVVSIVKIPLVATSVLVLLDMSPLQNTIVRPQVRTETIQVHHTKVFLTIIGPPSYILFTNWYDIQKVNNTQGSQTSSILFRQLRNAVGIDYHYKLDIML